MPTTVTSTIGTSQDYATPVLWEADTDDDLVTADEIQIGRISVDQEFTAGVNIADATVDSTRYRQLDVASGVKHNGIFGDGGAMISYSGSTFSSVDMNEDYVRVFDLRIQNNRSHASARGIDMTATNNSQVHRCILDTTQATSGEAINSSNNDDNIVTNCVVHGTWAYAFRLGNDHTNYYNCSHLGGTRGGYLGNSGVMVFKNCVFAGSSTEDVDDLGTSFADDCTTADTTIETAGGSNNRGNTDHGQDETDFYTNTSDGSEDLTPKAGADFIGRGVDLVTTPEFVNIDITGRDRDAEGDTWDQGAFQTFTAAGGGIRNPLGGPTSLRNPLGQ